MLGTNIDRQAEREEEGRKGEEADSEADSEEADDEACTTEEAASQKGSHRVTESLRGKKSDNGAHIAINIIL